MPNLWGIDEIIRVVCEFCDNQTLARLGRVNKSFSDPALDVLWDSLTSFANLLRLLPEELVTWHNQEHLEYGPPRPVSGFISLKSRHR